MRVVPRFLITVGLALSFAAPVAAADAPASVGLGGPVHAAAAGTYTDTLALDRQTCAALGHADGCTLTVTTTVGPLTRLPASASGAALVAAVTQCTVFYQQLNFGWLGISLMTDEIDVPMCWNGVTSWRNGWGPDCKVWPPIGYTATITWCNMYHNNTNTTQAGDNWYIRPYIPVTTTYFWARLNVRPNGTFYWTGGQG